MQFRPSSGILHLIVQSLTTIYNRCTTTLNAFENGSAKQALTDVQTISIQVLEIIGQSRHMEANPSPPLPTSSTNLAQSPAICADKRVVPLQHDQVEPALPQATPAAAVKETSINGQGRAKTQQRGSAALHTIGRYIFPPPGFPELQTVTMNIKVEAAPSTQPMVLVKSEEESPKAGV